MRRDHTTIPVGTRLAPHDLRGRQWALPLGMEGYPSLTFQRTSWGDVFITVPARQFVLSVGVLQAMLDQMRQEGA